MGSIKIGWPVKFGKHEWVIVFIPDTPHVIKKLANSLHRKFMKLDGCQIGKHCLRTVWEATHFAGRGRLTLQRSKLTIKHFEKDSLACMNVGLATQLLSNTMIQLFKTTLRKQHPQQYKAMAPTMGPQLTFLEHWNHTFSYTLDVIIHLHCVVACYLLQLQ